MVIYLRETFALILLLIPVISSCACKASSPKRLSQRTSIRRYCLWKYPWRQYYEYHLKLSVRSYLPKVHERLLNVVMRVVRTECEALRSRQEPVLRQSCMLLPRPMTGEAQGSSGPSLREFQRKRCRNKPLWGKQRFSILATTCGEPCPSLSVLDVLLC